MPSFKNIFVSPLLLAFLCACGASPAGRRMDRDAYPDFAALRAANVEGRDFSREVYDRRSPASVFAIHGGDIERATDRVARAIAGGDFNLYIFNGWLAGASRQLHVTAVHFDDPAAVAMASASRLAVSIHAQADRGAWVCVGGSNQEAARETATDLLAAGFEAEYPCGRLPGTNPRNIVNRAEKGGVQLELTPGLLERLENSPAALANFSASVRNAVFSFLKRTQSGQN